VIAHASTAVDATRRIEQKIDPSIKGLRWALLKDRSKLRSEQRADLDELIAHMTTKRTARAWLYREKLRDIMTRRQPNVVRAFTQAMVYQRYALQGRTDERGRRHDP
jgi:hypothetical protein